MAVFTLHTVVQVNRYDEYGTPASTNGGRFQYTGQMWIDGLDMYHYKARIYAPTLGRFLQTDPIGYADGLNLYAYAGNDPINRTDPTGLWGGDLVAIGYRDDVEEYLRRNQPLYGYFEGPGGGGGGDAGHPKQNPAAPATASAGDIIVTSYWKRQKVAGNPIADLGLQFCYGCASDFFTSIAKSLLLSAISHRPSNGRYPNAEQVRATYAQIRFALMNADQAARLADTSGTPGLLSAGQVYDYHVAVFARFGLPGSTFGGSYFTGRRSEAIASSWQWCPGCDR